MKAHGYSDDGGTRVKIFPLRVCAAPGVCATTAGRVAGPESSLYTCMTRAIVCTADQSLSGPQGCRPPAVLIDRLARATRPATRRRMAFAGRVAIGPPHRVRRRPGKRGQTLGRARARGCLWPYVCMCVLFGRASCRHLYNIIVLTFRKGRNRLHIFYAYYIGRVIVAKNRLFFSTFSEIVGQSRFFFRSAFGIFSFCTPRKRFVG